MKGRGSRRTEDDCLQRQEPLENVAMPNQAKSPTGLSQEIPITDGGMSTDDWTDIQLTEPGEDTWDIDLHLERGTVRTVVLRFHAAGLPGIVNSLLSDVDDEHVRDILARVVEQQDIDPAELVTEE